MKPQPPNIGREAADTVPSTPPAEVLDAIGDAAATYDLLQTCGVHPHFHLDERTGKLQARLYDEQGALLGVLAPSRVLDLACGRALGRTRVAPR